MGIIVALINAAPALAMQIASILHESGSHDEATQVERLLGEAKPLFRLVIERSRQERGLPPLFPTPTE